MKSVRAPAGPTLKPDGIGAAVRAGCGTACPGVPGRVWHRLAGVLLVFAAE